MWRFSDDTEVEPGGEVRGVSLFAQRLRLWLAQQGQTVEINPQPSAGVPLDVGNTGLLNAWLLQMLDRETRILGNQVKLTRRHDDISELPPAPKWAVPSDPDVHY